MAEETATPTEETTSTEETKPSLVSATEEKDPVKEATEEPNKSDSQTDEKGDEGAPDQYEAFKMPDGVEVNEELMGEFSGIAKDLNLTQDQAQTLVDLQTREMQKMMQAQVDSWNATRDEWVTNSKNDSEFGGANFEASIATMSKAIDAFGGDAFRNVLDETGMGDHPEILRFIYKVGLAVGEDRIHIGGNVRGERDVAKSLYTNSDHN